MEYGEDDDSDLIFLNFFYCFHFDLPLNQQTLIVEEIQNKNVSQWMRISLVMPQFLMMVHINLNGQGTVCRE